MNKKWQIAKKIDHNFISKFPEIDSNTLQLLYNRGIVNQDEIDRFLTPDYGTDLRDPFLFKDMERAVRRIFDALKNGEKITIFGDYDADGVTASVVLKKVLEKLGEREERIKNLELRIKNGKSACAFGELRRGEEVVEVEDETERENLKSASCKLQFEVDVYIPHRGREGYGINKEALEYIKKKGRSLVITVDCGISNYEEVAYGKSLGLDIIITDHHQPPIKLPEAYAILNPKVEGCGYPFKGLAGVGVAFKLAQGLSQENKKTKKQENKNLDGFEKWLLDLVAIGTIADLCPLVDENRVLVKYGLIVLNKTKNVGLKALFEVAGLPAQAGIAKNGESGVRYRDAERIMNHESGIMNGLNTTPSASSVQALTTLKGGTKEYSQKSKVKSQKLLIDTWNVGFQIAPRLNAAGRLSHANTAFKLLTTEDENEAFNIARELDDTNNKRQILTKNATESAIEIIKKEGQEGNLAIFAKNKNWESGIIGLVAGKLVEHYNKPAFVFTKIDNEVVASGRSIPEFDIMKALVKKEKNKKSPSFYLRRYGGHSQACGFSLEKEEYYDKFTKSILEVVNNELKEKDLSPSIFVDAEIGVEEADWDLRDNLENFAPFGQMNRQPLFAIKNLEILEIKAVGKEENHLKLKFKKGDSAIGAIGFQMNNDEQSWAEKLHIGDIIDAVCYVEVNEWNGNRELQLRVIDVRVV